LNFQASVKTAVLQVSCRKLEFTGCDGELNGNLQHVEKKKTETVLCAAVDTARHRLVLRVLGVGLCSEMMKLLKLSAESCVEGFRLTRVYTWVWH
jgi:hypothetical protein